MRPRKYRSRYRLRDRRRRGRTDERRASRGRYSRSHRERREFRVFRTRSKFLCRLFCNTEGDCPRDHVQARVFRARRRRARVKNPPRVCKESLCRQVGSPQISRSCREPRNLCKARIRVRRARISLAVCPRQSKMRSALKNCT